MGTQNLPEMGAEKLAEGVWVFRSRGFAGMLSTLIALDGDEALLIDPPMFAAEADEIRKFAEEWGLEVNWLAITHAHGDHAYGMFHFPDSLVVAQQNFWPFWVRNAPAEEEYFRRVLPGFNPPEVRPPNLLFPGRLSLNFARQVLFRAAPGHSPDGLMAELPEEGIWIMGDTVIGIPFLASGDRKRLLQTLKSLKRRWDGETIVMGHDRVLRGGEALEMIESNIRYLRDLEEAVREAIEAGKGLEEVLGMDLDEFGIPEDAIGELTRGLHKVNLRKVYEELIKEM